MKFIDIAEIKVKAGDGGKGMSHFRREKYVPFGGPDGGDGGKGGDIWIEADEGLSTLLDFRYKRNHEATDGTNGGTSNKAGRDGNDLVLKVPCGTLVKEGENIENSSLIGEILKHGERLIVAKGGRGGLGNMHFATSRNQAPTKVIPPEIGEKCSLILELKMMADVGIIGSPNAGKSTLITVISAARPKVADYPFTTLVPTLGVVSHKDAPPFVVADVPGLISGASTGKGLGHDFLKHIERTKILVHLIDGSNDNLESIIADYEGIITELRLYNEELLKRPRITVISKLDLINSVEEYEDNLEPKEETIKYFEKYLEEKGIIYLKISAAQRVNISNLLDKMVMYLNLEGENNG